MSICRSASVVGGLVIICCIVGGWHLFRGHQTSLKPEGKALTCPAAVGATSASVDGSDVGEEPWDDGKEQGGDISVFCRVRFQAREPHRCEGQVAIVCVGKEACAIESIGIYRTYAYGVSRPSDVGASAAGSVVGYPFVSVGRVSEMAPVMWHASLGPGDVDLVDFRTGLLGAGGMLIEKLIIGVRLNYTVSEEHKSRVYRFCFFPAGYEAAGDLRSGASTSKYMLNPPLLAE